MAYGILPAPGTKLGPCRDACHHVDCGWTRLYAGVVCRYCRKPIGYGTAYYRIGGATADLIHEACSDQHVVPAGHQHFGGFGIWPPTREKTRERTRECD